MNNFHTPVLLNEVNHYLDPRPGMRFIDATIGGGGHTQSLLEKGATVLGIDRDPDAITHARELLSRFSRACPDPRSSAPGATPRGVPSDGTLTLARGNFSEIEKLAQSQGFVLADGIIFDLGVSSHQLETPERGFSFNRDGPLDMRADPTSQGVTAADLVNSLSKHELTELFQKFGQVERASSIADAIISARRLNPFTTTGQLSRVMTKASRHPGRVHPATKVFQALRIAVNSELDNLEEALEQVSKILAKEGKLVVISFHSLEDGIVKRFLKKNSDLFSELTLKPVRPSQTEITNNPRARSAMMRVASIK